MHTRTFYVLLLKQLYAKFSRKTCVYHLQELDDMVFLKTYFIYSGPIFGELLARH